MPTGSIIFCLGHSFYKRADAYQKQNCLRLLSYVPRRGTIAVRHTDRCAITLHLAESSPGLRTYRGDDYFDEEVPQAPNVLAFSGDQLERVSGTIPALVHSVEDRGDRRPRFAMVFFGKMDDREFWPK